MWKKSGISIYELRFTILDYLIIGRLANSLFNNQTFAYYPFAYCILISILNKNSVPCYYQTKSNYHNDYTSTKRRKIQN